MDLYSTNKKGKIITHLHTGNAGHFYCGLADDYFEDDEKVLGEPRHNKVTCKDCIKQIKRTLKLARRYEIK
jgi:hypothetical protein